MFFLSCLDPEISRVKNQQGWVIKVTLHFTTLSPDTVGYKTIYLHKYIGDMKWSTSEHPHVNELCLTLLKVAAWIKLLLRDISLCMLHFTRLSLSLSLCAPFLLSVSLSLYLSLSHWNICHVLETASHQLCLSRWLCGRSASQSASVFSPIKPHCCDIIAGPHLLSCCLPGYPAMQQHLLMS